MILKIISNIILLIKCIETWFLHLQLLNFYQFLVSKSTFLQNFKDGTNSED